MNFLPASRLVLLGLVLAVGALLLMRGWTPVSATPTGDHEAGIGMPAPTDHLLDDDAEERQKEQRLRWIEEMHRTAPGVDWRAIERENGLREMERRADLLNTSSTSRWGEIGSSNQAGRMHTAVLGPDGVDGRWLYAGASLGGVWRARPDGSEWQPLSDNLYGGVRHLLIEPGDSGDPDVIIAATHSGAVWRSRDLGGTWETPAGLEDVLEVRWVGRAQTPGALLLYGRASVPAGNRAVLFASTDGGDSFQLRYQFSSNWSGDMWTTRVDMGSASEPIFVIHEGVFYRSDDLGFSFNQTTVIDGTATRARLAGSEAGAPHFYATLNVGGVWKLYRSRTAGNGFVYLQDLPDLWDSLEASIQSKNIVVFGGVEAWRSTNQGASFDKINSWGEYYGDPEFKLHADMMGIFCELDPDDPAQEIWYFNTDGGVYESRTQGQTVQNLSLSGLGVSQYYSTYTSSQDTDRIQVGSQDQGYQQGVRIPPTGNGPSTPFDQLISGDYGHLCSGDGSHGLVYSTYPGFMLIAEGEIDNPALHTRNFPAGADNLWLPPVVADPTDDKAVFFLGDKLWRAHRDVGNWNFVEHTSFNFLASGGRYLTAMAFAPSDSSKVYAVNDVGRMFHSEDGGLNWTESSGTAPGEHYFYGNALCVHPIDPEQAFVGGSGYSAVGVLRTTDGGQNWSAADTGLPETLTYDLCYSVDGLRVFAATETLPYAWDATTRWQPIAESGVPITLYWSVEAVADGRTIRFGTYGRGIWDYDSLDASTLLFSVKSNAILRGIAVDDGDVMAYDWITDQLSTEIDISDVITGNVDVDALCMLDDGSYLFSFIATEQVDGLIGGPNGTEVLDEDIVRFIPTQTGSNTAGSFEFYLDGSDLGLTVSSEDIDAIGVGDDGRLHLSFQGPWTSGGLSGKDEDIAVLNAISLGADTIGSFEMWLDGSDSDLKLAKGGEDIDAYSYLPAGPQAILSTTGDYRVPVNQTGDDDGVLRLIIESVGEDADGTFVPLLDLGDMLGDDAIDIDGLHWLQ